MIICCFRLFPALMRTSEVRVTPERQLLISIVVPLGIKVLIEVVASFYVTSKPGLVSVVSFTLVEIFGKSLLYRVTSLSTFLIVNITQCITEVIIRTCSALSPAIRKSNSSWLQSMHGETGLNVFRADSW